MMRPALGCLSAASLVAVLLATPSSSLAADKWISVRSENFFLVGNASEKTVRGVARKLEGFREGFGRLFPNSLKKSSVGTTVLVFRTDESFKPYKPLYQGKPANIAGYFQSGSDINYIAMTEVLEVPQIIYHEYVHALTSDSMAGLPNWIKEGIAEFYSTFAIQGGNRLQVGKLIDHHILLLRQKPMLSLAELFSVGYDSPHLNEAGKQGIFYAQSWALAHFLMLGQEQKRQKQFSTYLSFLAAGKPQKESFEGAFQASYEQIEKELGQYIRGLTFPSVTFTLRDAVTVEKEMSSSAISEAASLHHLGDMLAHIRRVDDAKVTLQKAIALDPKLAGPYGALGMMAVRESQYPEAAQHLKRAVELDGENYLTQYYYARMLERQAADEGERLEGEVLQTMRAALKKSLQLNPSFLEAASLLGYVNLAGHQDLDETISLLQPVVKGAPGRVDLTIMLADALVRKERFDEAKSVLAPVAASNAVDKRHRDSARDILEYIERRGAVIDEIRSVPTMKEPEEDEVDDTDSPEAADEAPEVKRASPNAKDTVLEEVSSERPAGPADPSTTPIIRKDARFEGTEEIRGSLVMLDCGKGGATLTVSTAGKAIKLHTPDPSRLEFISSTPSVKGEVACGPLKPTIPVRVLYRPGPGAGGSIGVPVFVEFVQP